MDHNIILCTNDKGDFFRWLHNFRKYIDEEKDVVNNNGRNHVES
jgi:hypothetical protein